MSVAGPASSRSQHPKLKPSESRSTRIIHSGQSVLKLLINIICTCGMLSIRNVTFIYRNHILCLKTDDDEDEDDDDEDEDILMIMMMMMMMMMMMIF